MAEPLDAAAEKDFNDLIQTWLRTLPGDGPFAMGPAQAIVARARARGDSRPGWYARALEALAAAVAWNRPPGPDQPAATVLGVLADLKACPWPRARWLAEAAHGLLVGPGAGDPASMLALLRQHPVGDDPSRPPFERLWTEVALCSQLAGDGQLADALAHGLEAESRVGDCEAPDLRLVTGQLLAYVFLSAGDCEGALATAPLAIAAASRRGIRSSSLHYNQLLALLAAGRFAEAADHLAEHPWLTDPALLSEQPDLRPLVAATWSAGGRAEDAERLRLADLEQASFCQTEPQVVEPNRAWLMAGVELAQGRLEMARRRIETCLEVLEQVRATLSPLNGTQLYATLSRICEAQGDVHGALRALKTSQAHCVGWVADSMHVRMQVLQRASRDPASPRHAARLQRVDEAVARCREDTEVAAPDGAAAPDAADSDRVAGTGANPDPRMRFFAHVAHEMRNPVHGLLGMTSLLMLSDLDDKQRRFVSAAKSSAQMLLRLCNDVLDLARLEAGHFDLAIEAGHASAILMEVTQLHQAMAGDKGLTLETTADADLPSRLMFDPLRVQQVLMNLVGNAVKFTRQGWIRVHARWTAPTDGSDTGWLRLTVRDSGPGISEDAQRQLFQEFSRGDAAVAASAPGTGLGLTLCQRLVEAMGGRIGVHSQVGQGSEFRVDLPLSLPPVPVETPVN